jgi:hypothetical protein
MLGVRYKNLSSATARSRFGKILELDDPPSLIHCDSRGCASSYAEKLWLTAEPAWAIASRRCISLLSPTGTA